MRVAAIGWTGAEGRASDEVWQAANVLGPPNLSHPTDIDDVVLNVLGTEIGYGVYAAVVAVTTSRERDANRW